MAYGIRAEFDPVRELAFGSISGTFAAIGTPLTQQARVVAINNSMNVDIYVSLDGINNNLRVAANSYKLIDFSTNRIRDDGLFIAVGTQFYARQVSGAPASGAVWVEVIYAAGGV